MKLANKAKEESEDKNSEDYEHEAMKDRLW